MKAIITVGISASGKSMFANEFLSKDLLGRGEVNRDNIRKYLMEKDGNTFSWDKWNWKREKEVTIIVDAAIESHAMLKNDIIISDTNLNGGRRDALELKLKQLGYHVEIMPFPVSLEEAWKRDSKRANGVGHSVIAKQYQEWLKYIERKTYIPNTTKPNCIVVDIDGTLAHMNGGRGAFEWSKVGQDTVDESVKQIIEAMYTTFKCKIVLLSGRDACCMSETCSWLSDNGVYFHELHMRQEGDMRKDTIVKEEIFWEKVAPFFNVIFAIDDRPSVARLWRELGLKVFQVGDPHIEF